MSLINNERSIFNLINLTHSGISVAEYPQIRSAVVDRFKQVYGSDIDISTGTADGIYVETYSLVINNILQTLKQLYTQMDIRTASGTFLDALCALNGVYRKDATYSTASLTITLSDTSISYDVSSTNKLHFADKSGTTWTSSVPVGQTITLQPNVATTLDVICDITGPIKAPVSWINQLISTELVATISQTVSAETGSYQEVDSQLRSRRNKSMSGSGVSVLESLSSVLLNLTGIEDVKIYNNNTSSTIIANDTANILPHSVYIIIRRNKNVVINNSVIGTYIYEKMTPGIGTGSSALTCISSTGIIKNYIYTQYVLGVAYTNNSLLQNVYWKESTPVNDNNTKITYTITKFYNFASYGNESYNTILATIKEYLYNLPISSTVSVIDLINQINNCDMLYRGQATYNCTSAAITDSRAATSNPLIFTGTGMSQTYTLKDTYFDFSNAVNESITLSGTNNEIATVVISIPAI